MSDFSPPTSATDTPNAEAIQLPGDGNSSASVTCDTAENGPRRVEIVALDQLTPYRGNARTHRLQQSCPDQR